MKRCVSFILVTTVTCHALNLRRTFPSWLAESSDESSSSSHRRITHTQCNLEDEFFYDTAIEMKAYGSTLECSDAELDEIGVALTIAHQNVIQEDPRLEDVIELLLNMCDTPTAIARSRMLTFKKNKNGFGFNWGGSGRCRWCRRDNDCDAACRLRRFLWKKREKDGSSRNWNGNGNGRFKREWEWERIWNWENKPPSPPPIPAPTPPTNDGSAGNLARFVATANPTTSSPTFPPTARPSPAPTPAPTSLLTSSPTGAPSAPPSVATSDVPSMTPSVRPSISPSVSLSGVPSDFQTVASGGILITSTDAPSAAPSIHQSVAPSVNPSAAPTSSPTATSLADSTTTDGTVTTKPLEKQKGGPLRSGITSGVNEASSISSLDETSRIIPVGEVTGFRLWNTTDEDNPQFLKIIEHADILDVQLYGSSLSIEADYSGDVDKVVFDYDDQENYRTENNAPYMLASDNGEGRFNTMVELSDVGTHTITATPYSSDGEKLTSVLFAILIVDGSTNAVQSAAPGSREELINILEDDLIFYLSGEVNKQFFFRPGHCLEGNLVFMDVVLTETSEKKAACETDDIPTSAPTASTAGPITSALYTHECLDVFEGSTADGAPIVKSLCDSGRDSQMWNFVPIDDNNGRSCYQIRASHSGKCIGVEINPQTYEAAIVQLPCGTEPSKLFLLPEIETDRFIATTYGGDCLAVDASSSIGAIQQQACQELSITQRWDIGALIPVPTGAPTPTPLPGYTPAPTPLESGAGPIEIELSGKCVDVTSVDSHSDGAQIIQNDCQGPGRLSQMWIFVPVDSVYYQIRASHSHKCIGVLDAATNDNALVVQLPCGTEPHKLWRIDTPNYGGKMLRAKHSDRCLEVYDWDESSGVGLVQNFCGNVLNQKFDIKTDVPAYY